MCVFQTPNRQFRFNCGQFNFYAGLEDNKKTLNRCVSLFERKIDSIKILSTIIFVCTVNISCDKTYVAFNLKNKVFLVG